MRFRSGTDIRGLTQA